ncbi:MAG: PHP domain-containing protein [Acholeplasmataceae bacterium]|jgi:histidinol-phosphatase (PHP family)
MTKYHEHHANYHTHNWLCRHAGGKVIDYAKEAVKHGLKILGISDHAPFPILDKYSKYRMSIDEFYQIYLKEFDEASKYAKQHQLIIYKGLEMEYYDNYDAYYQKLLKDLDYLILGQHYLQKPNTMKSVYDLRTLEDIKEYSQAVIKGLRSGYFSMLCHPDVCFWGIKEPTDEMYEALRPMIQECVKLDIPLEINANGIRRVKYERGLAPNDYQNYRYPRPKFWQMVAEEGGVGIVASDAHSPDVLNDFAIKIAYRFAKDMNVKVITILKFKENIYKKR